MQIRAMGHADVNIHMVTAEAGQDFRDKCLRNGADGYLVKPVNKASLNEVLEIVKKDRLKQLRLPGLNLSPNRNTMGPGLAALQQQ
jgi:CheY-like chemotaxis protein